MNMVFDLFDAPIVPGLAGRDDFLSRAEGADLIAHIDGVSLSPFKFQQWTGKRLTKASAGAMISNGAASRRPSQFLIGCCP